MNIILQFNFETGDKSCRCYQVYIIVKNLNNFDYSEFEDSISSYFESNDDDLDYEDHVEAIMRESGLTWEFKGAIIPESKSIYSLWI